MEEAGFQQYTRVPANMAAPIPDNLGFNDTVVLPLSVACAAAALYENSNLGLTLPEKSIKETGNTILIWGGSSCVGSSAIQLARASGYNVVTTAPSRNFDHVKGLGAMTVFDHTDPDIVTKLVDALAHSICVGGFDAVGKSTAMCAEVIERVGGKRVVSTLAPPQGCKPMVVAVHQGM